MSRENETNGLQMTSSNLPFEIATYGSSGTRNQSTIIAMAPEYQSGTETTLSGTSYYATNAGTEAIRLQYSTGESEIGPGGSGVLNLYLISKVDGSLNIDIELDVTAYATVDVYDLDENGNKIQATDDNNDPIYEEDGITPVYKTTATLKEVSDITVANSNITSTYLETLRSAASYIRGHILFFEGEGEIITTGEPGEETVDNDSSYYYRDPKITRKYEWSSLSTTVDKVHHIPIYWMWPNTLGQILLDGNYNMRSGIPLVKDANNATEKAAMATYLKDNKRIVFSNAGEISDSMIVNHPTSANFELMSSGYNGADFIIGSNIEYFMIELTVSLHEENEE